MNSQIKIFQNEAEPYFARRGHRRTNNHMGDNHNWIHYKSRWLVRPSSWYFGVIYATGMLKIKNFLVYLDISI